jgi:acetyl-CoA carboxylase biotin carboxyl carrier protein
MSMVPVEAVSPNRRRVRNVRGNRRPRVYIVARNTSRERLVAHVEANITGTVWKIEVSVGDRVEEGDTVLILESMKMEMPIEAEDDGTVAEIRVEEGETVKEGDVLVVLS